MALVVHSTAGTARGTSGNGQAVMMSGKLMSIDRAKLVTSATAIVKADQFSALLEARELLENAHQYAGAIKASAAAAVEAARKEGYEQGAQQARAELATQITQTVARLESAFVSLEARIVNTVMSAVQQILREIDERTLMERLIRRVLAEGRSQKQLRLRVSASQFDQVNQWLAAILQDFPEVDFIDVLKDPGGAPGTCVLESEFGVVDASLESQLAAVRLGLVNTFVRKRLAGSA
jgi:type III secretion protein L